MEMDLLGYETGAPPPQRVTAGGRTIAWRESGYDNRAVLVLLHGVGSAAASWGPQYVSLPSRGLRVIGWDAPGYGGSDRIGGAEPTPADYAEALRDFVDALGLERFSLVGHSMGALIAAAFCRMTGARRVEKLILAAPTAGYAHASAEARARAIDGRIADMQALGPDGVAEKRASVLLSPQAPKRAILLAKAVMRALRPDGYADAVGMLGRGDTIAEGAGIVVPTLVLCGTADQVTPEEGCRRIAAAIPGARYESVTGPGHALYVEMPGPFDDAVLRFLGIP
ncbi:MAG TPA: alpha/beta hydrolase [Stellaceae bacterium]|nr:alpha/beta hydrolase [Stellaceae bacterium]